MLKIDGLNQQFATQFTVKIRSISISPLLQKQTKKRCGSNCQVERIRSITTDECVSTLNQGGAVPHFYIWVRLWAGVRFHYSIVRMMTALICGDLKNDTMQLDGSSWLTSDLG